MAITLRRRETEEKEAQTVTNPHYTSLSLRCMWAKYISLVILFVYLAVMLAMYRSYITYDNLAYLLRDLSSSGNSVSHEFSEIRYDEQKNLNTCIFRGGFAAAGNSEISLYQSTAAKTFSYPSNSNYPILVPSDKYLLMYDLGGTGYSLYTDLTRVFSGNTQGAIDNASVSDKGDFLLVSRARDSRYVVSCYDSSFRKESDYYKGKCVSDALLSRDGKKMLIVTFDTVNADFTLQTELYRRGEENPFATFSRDGLLPLCAEFFEDNSFAVICDTGVLFFNENGEMISEYKMKESLTAFGFSDNSLAITVSENATGDKNTIILFDKEGKIGYNAKIDNKVRSVSLGEDNLYVLTPSRALKITRSGETYESEVPGDCISITEAGDFAIVSTNRKSVAVFNDFASRENN